ncbi:hypothetical protein CCAN2_1930031 [Capnocytophaga canimorsus]|nr:hypothetical protein CCAN2_1930031 [Capnocytophaga canimorsus]
MMQLAHLIFTFLTIVCFWFTEDNWTILALKIKIPVSGKDIRAALDAILEGTDINPVTKTEFRMQHKVERKSVKR